LAGPFTVAWDEGNEAIILIGHESDTQNECQLMRKLEYKV